MALRDHVEGRESVVVAVFSVVIWLGLCFVFGLPQLLAWLVAVLLFVGGVVKSGGSSTEEGDPPAGGATRRGRPRRSRAKKSIYGPPE
jgi:hypothetical protein